MKVSVILPGSASIQNKGVCIAVWTSKDLFWIDAGFTSFKALSKAKRDCEKLSGLPLSCCYVSHRHSDHFSDKIAGWLKKLNVAVAEVGQTRSWDLPSVEIWAWTVRHNPTIPTYGFSVAEPISDKVAAFCIEGRPELSGIPSTYTLDFIYIEANHDPDLLLRFPQSDYHSQNAQWHLDNKSCGQFLAKCQPKIAVIGNLSESRNTPALAKMDVERLAGMEVHLATECEPHKKIPKVWEI